MLLLSLISASFAAPTLDDTREALRRELASFQTGEHEGCATGAVEALRAHGGLAPLVKRPSPPPPPGVGGATDSCWGQQLDNRLVGTHFVVEWDDGVTSEANAQNFLDWLEESLAIETTELGWNSFNGDGAYLMPAYIESGRGASAYTTVDSCPGVGDSPYIVAYSGSFSDRSWAQTMAAHELNHALQFSYGNAMEFWYWEATATWIEDYVYGGTDWYAYYVSGYTEAPEIAMGASDQRDQTIFYHMYGMAIWNRYLDEYQGGPDVIRETWEYAATQGGFYTVGPVEFTEAAGVDFAAAYKDFIVRNIVMDYEDQRVLPSVSFADRVVSLPAEGGLDSGTGRPQALGQNYIRFDKDAGQPGEDLLVRFDGESDGAWVAILAEVSETEILRTVEIPVVDGEGEARLEGFGEGDVVLVVSPMADSGGRFSYAWSAESVAPEVEEDTAGEDSAVSDGAGEGGETDIEKTVACGCAAASGPSGGGASALALMLGAGLLARRRR